MRYTSQDAAADANPERIGILLINSGTPTAPTPAAVRAFLARFLARFLADLIGERCQGWTHRAGAAARPRGTVA